MPWLVDSLQVPPPPGLCPVVDGVKVFACMLVAPARRPNIVRPYPLERRIGRAHDALSQIFPAVDKMLRVQNLCLVQSAFLGGKKAVTGQVLRIIARQPS